MLVKYVKNEHRLSFNEDGTVKEGVINGHALTEDDINFINEKNKLVGEKVATLNAEYAELEAQKHDIVEKQKELTAKYDDEFEGIRHDLQEKVFNNYNFERSSQEIVECKPNNLVWWLMRWF
jgi:hypothetical protein